MSWKSILISSQISLVYQEMFTSFQVYLEWKPTLTFTEIRLLISVLLLPGQVRVAKDTSENKLANYCNRPLPTNIDS